MMYRTEALPLRCVRPFKLKEITLSASGISADSSDLSILVTNYLTKKVRA